jgi:hypothetical protein
VYNFATIKQVITAHSTCSRVVRQEPFARTANTHFNPTTSCTLQTCISIAHCRVHQPSPPGCDTHIPSHCLQSTSIDMTSAQAPTLLACVCGMPLDAYACSIPCAVNACWQQPGGHTTHPGASTTAKPGLQASLYSSRASNTAKQRLHSAPPTPCYPPLSAQDTASELRGSLHAHSPWK